MNSRGHFNGVKTFGLFVVLWVLLLGIGALLANGTGSSMFLWLFAAIGVGTTFYGYWRSDTIAIKAMRAKPVSEQQAPAMYRIVRELSQHADQPMPRLYISPTSQPNAFATGRNPANAVVCCTSGLLQLLDERELRGVLGHELMHVYNRDILISSVAAAIAGIITSLGHFLLFFGGRGRNVVGMLGMLGLMVLAPLAAAVIRMGISRTREYDADADGAQLTGDPMALAAALDKLDRGTKARPLKSSPQLQNVSHLMIANPLRGGMMHRLFASHPPMADRISRLRDMAAGR